MSIDYLSPLQQDIAAVWLEHRPTWSYIRPEWQYAGVTGATRPNDDPRVYKLKDGSNKKIEISINESNQREALAKLLSGLFNFDGNAFCSRVQPGCRGVDIGWTQLNPIEIIDQFIASDPHLYFLPYPFVRPANCNNSSHYQTFRSYLNLFQQAAIAAKIAV